jgi:hypothetical protein
MDYRNILATGFLLLCGAVFVHSLKSANAFPQGPNVSMGSNPIENFYGNTTNPNIAIQNDFVITTVLSNNDNCRLSIDSNIVNNGTGDSNPLYYRWTYPSNSPFTTGSASLKVGAGSTLSLTNCSSYYISGYYTH